MKRVLLLAALLVSQTASAAETAESVNARIKAGKEVGWLIEGTLNEDDQNLAVLFTARAKGALPARFPILINGDEVSPVDTDAINEDACVLENAVVLTVEKRVVGRVKLADPESAQIYFPGRNHGSLHVLWGPEIDGWNFGVLIYGSKWDSPEVLLIETGDGFLQTSIKAQLDAAVRKFIGTGAQGKKGIKAAEYAISYQPAGVVKPAAKRKIGDPLTVKLAFSAEVPKSDTAPYIEGTVTVVLETSETELNAKVLKVEPATPQ